MKNGLQTGCLILGVLCLLYYVAIIIYAGITADFAWIWALGGVVLLALRQGMRYVTVHPDSGIRFVVRFGWVILAAAVLVMLYIGGQIIAGMASRPEQNLEYVIVLGAQVRGSEPSRALRKRLDRAAEYAGENPDTLFFLSGGKGSGEDISEAEAMARYLIKEKDMDESRLILEDRSTSTWENLKFCNEIKEIQSSRVGIISNDFHVYRAARMAKRQGYQKVVRIPAPSDALMQPHYVLREICAVLVAMLRGQI